MKDKKVFAERKRNDETMFAGELMGLLTDIIWSESLFTVESERKKIVSLRTNDGGTHRVDNEVKLECEDEEIN